MVTMAATGEPGWQAHAVRWLQGDRYRDLPARRQVPTAGWNRVAGMPYLAYMPERDQLIMLLYLDYRPTRPAVMFSDDHGTTWTPPRLLLPQATETGNEHLGVSLTYLGDGRLVYNDEQSRWFSTDYGQTWPASIAIAPGGNGKPWGGWQWEPYLVDRDPATGRVTRLAEVAYSHEGTEYPAMGYFSQAYIRFSDDGAMTWGPETAVPQWHGINEVALVRAANGDLVAGCRTDLPRWFRDPAHRPPGLHEPDLYSGFGVSRSHDDGLTWSEVSLVHDHGRHFTSMVLLPGGALVMTYVVRIGYGHNPDGFPLFGIEAITSHDHGATWDLEHRLILDEWTGSLRGPCSWFPSPQSTSTVLLPDQSLLTAYGRAARCLPTDSGSPGPPRDLGLVQWQYPGSDAAVSLPLNAAAG